MTYAKPGRASVKVRVRRVETVPCSGWAGNHELVNSGQTVVCCGCGETWAALDAEIRRGAV